MGTAKTELIGIKVFLTLTSGNRFSFKTYFELKVDHLVPFWICVFLHYFGAELKQNDNIRISNASTPTFNRTWSTFFPAKLTSRYGSTKFFLSPSPPKTCFMVWTKASSTANPKPSLNKVFFKGSQVWMFELFTLRHIFCTVDFEVQSSPSHRDACWHQKIALYVVLLLIQLPLLGLRQKRKPFTPFWQCSNIFEHDGDKGSICTGGSSPVPTMNMLTFR